MLNMAIIARFCPHFSLYTIKILECFVQFRSNVEFIAAITNPSTPAAAQPIEAAAAAPTTPTTAAAAAPTTPTTAAAAAACPPEDRDGCCCPHQ